MNKTIPGTVSLFHPPDPELSEQLFSRVRYVAGRHATENEVRNLSGCSLQRLLKKAIQQGRREWGD
jgi:hypothetical protein